MTYHVMEKDILQSCLRDANKTGPDSKKYHNVEQACGRHPWAERECKVQRVAVNRKEKTRSTMSGQKQETSLITKGKNSIFRIGRASRGSFIVAQVLMILDARVLLPRFVSASAVPVSA